MSILFLTPTVTTQSMYNLRLPLTFLSRDAVEAKPQLQDSAIVSGSSDTHHSVSPRTFIVRRADAVEHCTGSIVDPRVPHSSN